MQTAGTVTLKPKIKNTITPIKFNIIKAELNIEFDGIIGMDFLKSHNAIINIKDQYLQLENFGKDKIIKIKLEPASEKSITLPPRRETAVQISIINHITEGVCPKIQIKEGIYVANAILKAEDNLSITTIVNTTEDEVKIPQIQVELEPFC